MVMDHTAVDAAVRAVLLDGAKLDVDWDESNSVWRSAITIAHSYGETIYPLYFEHTVLEAEDDSIGYVTTGVVMIMSAELEPDVIEEIELLQAVNEANIEPGVKFRLAQVIDESGAELVVETDTIDDRVTPDELREQVTRLAEVILSDAGDMLKTAATAK